MKILCLIFSFYVLLLAVRPCCADDCIAKTGAKSTQAGKMPAKDCQGCSPFFSCGNCAGFVLTSHIIHAAKPVSILKVEHNSAYQQPFLKEISLSIWQPPRLS